MSRYDFESGTLKLSTAEFPKFKKALLEKISEARTSDYLKAQKLHETLTKKGKGKLESWHEAFYETAHNMQFHSVDWYQLYRQMAIDVVPNPAAETTKFVSKTLERPRKTLLKPKKMHFAPPKANELQFSVIGEDGSEDASIFLDPKARTVSWSVPSNNHAVERAHEAWLARVFFALLDKVIWTRGTGGEIVGNDEYNRDSREDGGGANYVTRRYGPDVKPKAGSTYALLSSRQFGVRRSLR